MANDHEDRVIEALKRAVGDDGVVLRRRQEFRSRGGKFSADQFVDITVDSPHDEWYIGIEAKTAKASSSPKFYFSNYFPVEQMEKQDEYRDKSGRELFVAVEVRDLDDDDYDLLFPLDYFLEAAESGDSGIEWPVLVGDGVLWTDTLGQETFGYVRE